MLWTMGKSRRSPQPQYCLTIGNHVLIAKDEDIPEKFIDQECDIADGEDFVLDEASSQAIITEDAIRQSPNQCEMPILLPSKFQGTKTRCLLDTGSHFSTISTHLAQRQRLNVKPGTYITRQNSFSASGSQLNLRGTAEIMLEISGLKIPHTFYVCDNLSEQIILGRTFLDDSSAVIDFRNKTITVQY